jgi:hypothetical protein
MHYSRAFRAVAMSCRAGPALSRSPAIRTKSSNARCAYRDLWRRLRTHIDLTKNKTRARQEM